MTSKAHVIKTRMPVPAPTPEALLTQVHAALEEMKAKDAVEIDVRGKTSIADFLVVVSGTSTRHVKSIADEVVKFAKNCGVMPLGVEGEREAEGQPADGGQETHDRKARPGTPRPTQRFVISIARRRHEPVMDHRAPA